MLKNLVRLDLEGQYYSDHSCTGSDGTVFDTNYLGGNEANEQNYGLEGNFLGSEVLGQLRSLRELRISGNYFSGSIASEIGSLTQLTILFAGMFMCVLLYYFYIRL